MATAVYGLFSIVWRSVISVPSPMRGIVYLIQIRDLDQTVIGNPAHDSVRLGLWLASAARGSDPGATAGAPERSD